MLKLKKEMLHLILLELKKLTTTVVAVITVVISQEVVEILINIRKTLMVAILT